MIPKIIHQTWKIATVPPNYSHMVQSWRDKNPNWEYRIWTDDDLETLVREHYPKFLNIFKSYPRGVQRADAGRYLILHHCGGVYTDIDTSCLKSFDLLAHENRIILCEEPQKHWPQHIAPRGFKRIIFNGTIASPKGHPFWLYLLECMTLNMHSTDVLDATGPFLLTGCIDSYSDQEAFSVNHTHLFCHLDAQGHVSQDLKFGDYKDVDLSIHHWASSWAVKWNDRLLGFAEFFARQIAKLAIARNFVASGRVRKIDKGLLHSAITTTVQSEVITVHRTDHLGSVDQNSLGEADWHLFVHHTIEDYSSHVVPALLSLRHKIVVPHCVKSRDSELSVDLESFAVKPQSKLGLALLPFCRAFPKLSPLKKLMLQDVRYLNKLELDHVGGMMILVHHTVFRAGLRIKSKSDGSLEMHEFCQDLVACNFKAIGLPNLVVPCGEIRFT